MFAVLKAAFHYFIFTSLYIACCALLMVYQVNQLLHLQYDITPYFFFVFFSTICSYNFHWYLSAGIESETLRVRWTLQHKTLHLVLFCIGLIGSVCYYFYFIQHWVWLGGAALLTFLYSAPKLSFPPFGSLRKIAYGKTLFLAFVWTYVTTFLPIAFDGHHWDKSAVLFCCHRFFFIYAICILFDFRDRDYDKKEGIRSMITHLSVQGINYLFYTVLFACAAVTAALYFYHFSLTAI